MEFLKKYSLLLTIFFSFGLIFTSSIAGIRIPFYKISQCFFIVFSMCSLNKKNIINNYQKYFFKDNVFVLLVLLFSIKIFSGLLIMIYNYAAPSFDQYFKWVIVESVDLLFYFYLIKYFFNSDFLIKKTIINVFAITIIFSSIFSVFQFIIYYFYQYNILSLITSLPFIWTQDNLLETYAWGPILRVGGLMVGPNVHATTLCLLLPIILYAKRFRYQFYIQIGRAHV